MAFSHIDKICERLVPLKGFEKLLALERLQLICKISEEPHQEICLDSSLIHAH